MDGPASKTTGKGRVRHADCRGWLKWHEDVKLFFGLPTRLVLMTYH
jgi:hypothetical protein